MTAQAKPNQHSTPAVQKFYIDLTKSLPSSTLNVSQKLQPKSKPPISRKLSVQSLPLQHFGFEMSQPELKPVQKAKKRKGKKKSKKPKPVEVNPFSRNQ
jgi:hypothetical protein